MSSTETTARSALCFSGWAVCAAICAVLRGHPVVLGLLPQSRHTAWSHGWHCSGMPRAALTRPCPGLDLPVLWLSPLQGVPGLMVEVCL